MIKVRRIILEEDYPTLKTWWERRGMEAPQQEILPQVGVVSELDGFMTACAFLYQDIGGVVGFLEWEATNPDCHSAMTTLRALNNVFAFFEGFCRDKKIKILFSWTKSERGDGRLLARRNWKKCPGERHDLMALSLEEAICP